MLVLVFSAVFIILRVDANELSTENPEVRLFYSYDGNQKYITVWKDKPLKIIIENAYPRYIWCRSKYANNLKNESDFIHATPFNTSTISKLSVENVTAEMSTMWACTVLKNYQPLSNPYWYQNQKYNAKDLFFELHVRGAKAVILRANSRSLPYVTTNLSVNYDGETSYTYVDGEDLEISCKKVEDALDIPSTLRLEYFNAAGNLLFETISREKKPHLLRIVLKSNNDKDYLDCIRTVKSPLREYRYRTTFLKKKPDFHAGRIQHSMILSVDGQDLTTILSNDTSSNDDYIVRYMGAGTLNVTCRKKNTQQRGSLSFYERKKNAVLTRTLKSASGAVISVNVSKSNVNNKTVTCSINNTDVQKPNARILFLQEDEHIRGLVKNNILYQYTNNETQWTIEYQYSINETLNLTCVSKTSYNSPRSDPGFFRWKFEGKTYDSPAIFFPNYSSVKWTQETFRRTLDTTHNGTKLRCIYFKKEMSMVYEHSSVVLIFRLKPDVVAEAIMDESTSAMDSKVQIISIAASVGTIIGIITMICLVLWRKRTKRTHLIESDDNLSNQNESPIPAYPSQWETNCDDSHYAKIDEEVMEDNDTYTTHTDKLCRMPDKRQSNTSENHYTEIDDYFKPKTSGLAVKWNSTGPSNFKKEKDGLRGTPSHNSKNETQNNFCDSKRGTYDKLRDHNSNENFSNTHKTNKNKTVTFRQISNDLRPERNDNEGNCKQHSENNDRRLQQNSDGHYANVNQAGDLQKKLNYESHLLKNERSENSDYAVPFDELEVICKNDLYS